jgi:hypothetical protein
MGTKLYLTDDIVVGGPIAHRSTYSDDLSHPWPDVTTVYNMSPAAGSSEIYAGGNFQQLPDSHDSHVRTFVSGRLRNNAVFTSGYTFAAKMEGSHYRIQHSTIYDPETGERTSIYTTYSMKNSPRIYLYSWKESTGQVQTLADTIASPEFDYDVTKNYTYSVQLTAPTGKTVTAGDRLVCEIHYDQIPGFDGWPGYGTEHLYFNTTDSYISFSDATFDTNEVVENSRKFIYNFRYKLPKTIRFPYSNYASYRTSSAKNFKYKILTPIFTASNDLGAMYDMYSYRYITIYAETESTARGRVSLNMTPRASVSFNSYFDDYTNKWAFPEPTFHRFIMIDDFEGYDDLGDMALRWTISDGLVTFSAIKTFSSMNMEDYDVMTFYAKGSLPTALQAQFGDKYGNSSSIVPFLITDRWERYEQSVSWGECNPQVVTSVHFSSEYNSSITLDDIFMLNHNPETENTDWMKMNLTNIDLSRAQKMATFKIPFRQQEMIQFSGDKNAEGELRIRSIDTMQTSFLDECMKNNTPLYFRYKNMGLPIVIRNSNRSFKQIIPTQVSSEVSIPFFEIYDYSKF